MKDLLDEYMQLRRMKCGPFKKRRMHELKRVFRKCMGNRRLVVGRHYVLTQGVSPKGVRQCAVYTRESWERSQERRTE